jgi:hypothetical protein
LSGQDQPRRVGGGGLQCLTGEEYQRRLDDGEHQRQKRHGNQTEFNGDRTVLPTDQPARCAIHDRGILPDKNLVRMFSTMAKHPNFGGICVRPLIFNKEALSNCCGGYTLQSRLIQDVLTTTIQTSRKIYCWHWQWLVKSNSTVLAHLFTACCGRARLDELARKIGSQRWHNRCPTTRHISRILCCLLASPGWSS